MFHVTKTTHVHTQEHYENAIKPSQKKMQPANELSVKAGSKSHQVHYSVNRICCRFNAESTEWQKQEALDNLRFSREYQEVIRGVH